MDEVITDPIAEDNKRAEMLGILQAMVSDLAEVLDTYRAAEAPIEVVPIALTHCLVAYMETLKTHDEKMTLITRVTKLLLTRITHVVQ